MSNSFIQLWLATLAGAATFYIIQEIYFEIKARIRGRKYSKFLEEFEEDIWEELE